MRAWLDRISPREKIAIGTAIAAAIVFGIRFLVVPIITGASMGEKRLALRKADLSRMETMAAEYEALSGRVLSGASPLKAGESLYAFVDTTAGKSGIRSKVSYMKPSTVKSRDGNVSLSVVEIKVVDMDMTELTGFLHGVESSGSLIHIRGISLTRIEKSQLLTAVISIETVAL